MKKRIFFSLLPVIVVVAASFIAIGLQHLIATGAPPTGWTQNANPTDSFVHNNFNGAILSTATYGTAGNGTITLSTTGNNLSTSQGTLTLTGSGSVLGITASGTYTYSTSNSLTNSEPVYVQTGGSLEAWYTGSGTVTPGNTWVITGTSSLGISASSSLAGNRTLPLAGQQFLTRKGIALAYTGTGALTASATGAYLNSGASQPCSVIKISSTAACSIGISSNNINFPVPANVPIEIPLNDLNSLWISSTGSTAGYFWLR